MDRLIVLAIAVVAASGPPQGTQQQPPSPAERPSFSGRWHFNPERSDDAREKMRQALAGRRSGGAGPGGGAWGGHRSGSRGGGMGRGRMGGSDRGRSQDSQGTMRSLVEAPEEMAITHTETEIAIVEKDGRLRTLHPDGQKYRAEAGTSEIKSWWEQNHLIVETSRDDGPKLTETIALAADGKQLLVDVRIDGRSGPLTLHRVYDTVTAE